MHSSKFAQLRICDAGKRGPDLTQWKSFSYTGLCMKAALAAISLIGAGAASSNFAFAQVIVETVNGDPVTNIDIEQRVKLLRVLRKPATPEAALKDLNDDRIKSSEVRKYNVKPGDADINHEIIRVAGEMKIDPNALVGELQRAGVTPDHYKGYFGTNFAFNLLIQSLNKGVEASEVEVRAELAKEGGKAAAGTEYTVRQIILPLLGTAAPAEIEARVHLAEQIRARFNDCTTGVPLVEGMGEVVVKNPISRTSLQLGEAMKQVLDKTPVGHVTAPQRTGAGIEMLALCSKGAATDDTAAREAVSQKLLAAHYAKEEARMLAELRDRAVIQKR